MAIGFYPDSTNTFTKALMLSSVHEILGTPKIKQTQ